MALPMDEQRILEEMERMLAADDPRLAARLSAFGQPGVGQVLRTRRAKALLSLLMVAVIATAASVIYMMSVFRPGGMTQNTPHGYPTAQQTKTLPAERSLPFTSPAQCGVVKIAPRACTAWSSARP
ncbi:MAG TPA: DUF3040 domain-containing protein [Streptosporangiaceae bacterium]|nr:DUF3040 domain-containing protein [Streptosporangiaceae bacterium]